MGLSICVHKPKPLGDLNPNKIDMLNICVLSKSPELEVFSRFVFERKNEYYDLKGTLKTIGYNIDDLELIGYGFGRGASYNYNDKKHDLYDTYKFLDPNWSNVYCKSKEELFETEIFKEFKDKHLFLLKSYGYKPLYKFYATGNKTTYYNLNSAKRFAAIKVGLIIKNPLIIHKVERCLIYSEVGYQGKGANGQFYADDMWNSNAITDKKTVLEHWNKYFSRMTPKEPHKLTESEIITISSEARINFKKNIVDKFVEGETFLVYC